MNKDNTYALTMALIDKAKKDGIINLCGHCSHWMKSSECPKEINVNGYNRGPSCNTIACDNFKSTEKET